MYAHTRTSNTHLLGMICIEPGLLSNQVAATTESTPRLHKSQQTLLVTKTSIRGARHQMTTAAEDQLLGDDRGWRPCRGAEAQKHRGGYAATSVKRFPMGHIPRFNAESSIWISVGSSVWGPWRVTKRSIAAQEKLNHRRGLNVPWPHHVLSANCLLFLEIGNLQSPKIDHLCWLFTSQFWGSQLCKSLILAEMGHQFEAYNSWLCWWSVIMGH